MKQIHVPITKQMKDQLKKLAQKSGQTMTALIRMAIQEFLIKNK